MTPVADDLKFVIPLAHGIAGAVKRAINADTDGLRAALVTLIRDNAAAPGTSGPVDLPAGTVIVVRPNSTGQWTLPTRPPGAVFLAIPGAAALPTSTDGFLDTDIIAVAGSGTGGVGGGSGLGTVLLSDSFTGTSTSWVELEGTSVDQFAGGSPATWSTGWDPTYGTDHHTQRRQDAGGSIDIYSDSFARLPVPVSNVTVQVVVGAATNGGFVALRGDVWPPNTAAAKWIGFKFNNSGGAMQVSAAQRDGGTVTNLGTNTGVAAGDIITATLVGQTITMKKNGVVFSTSTATVTANTGHVTLGATTYITLNLESVTVAAA